MKLKELMEQEGFIPKTVSKWESKYNEETEQWDHKETILPNDKVVPNTQLKVERTLIENNVEQDLLFLKVCGPYTLFGFKTKSSYAFFMLDRLCMDSYGVINQKPIMRRLGIKDFSVVLNTLTKFDKHETIIEDKDKMNAILLSNELGDK